MDDDYELISKEELTRLRDENNRLRKGYGGNEDSNDEKDYRGAKSNSKSSSSQSKSSSNDVDSIVSQVVEVMQNESKKEREALMESLNEIKDLNKSTLDNLLEKTRKLDERLEGMVNTTSKLVENLSNLINELIEFKENKGDNNFEDIKNAILELEYKIDSHGNNSSNSVADDGIVEKLSEIEIFMKNLRTLLSYVKPSDMVLDKKTQNNNFNQNSSNNMN